MKKIMLVMRQEILCTLRSAGYVIFAFIIPVVAVLILSVVKLFRAGSGEESNAGPVSVSVDIQLVAEGFVDQSGLIQVIPAEFHGYLFAYENEDQANQALEAGQIEAYYVIPRDYLDTGKTYYVYPNTRSYLSDGQDWVIAKTLMTNLLDADMDQTDKVWNPVRFYDETNLSILTPAGVQSSDNCLRPGAACETNKLVRYLPSLMAALFFAVFMISSNLLFNSVGKEKENRVIEVLLLSVSPRQLLAGKTLGLGLAGLLQTAIWLGAVYISFNLSGSTLRLPENFVFPIDILIWGVVFFLGGYGLYASLMAGAGALVPRMKEAGVANYIAISPLFISYAFGLIAPLANAADSGFIVFLSMFPLTSPVVMIMRLTNNQVPLWQPLLAALLVFLTAGFTLHAAASMFHTKNLLSGQPFSLKRYLAAVTGR